MKKGRLSEISWVDRFDFQKAVIFSEEDLSCQGSKFQIIRFAPGKEVGAHYHNERVEVFYVCEGSGVITVNNEPHTVVKNDYLLIQRGDRHAIKCTGNNDLVILVYRTNDPGPADMLFEK